MKGVNQMKWLLAIFRNFSVKLVLGALIDFLRMLAKKTETQIDDEAVDLIEIIFKEAKLI